MQFYLFILDMDYRLRITLIIHKQIWGYEVQEKLYLGIYANKKG
jgi:hypothetical protein